MTFPAHSQPLAEYARVLYEAWDKEGRQAPPKGYASWMAYWEFEYNSPHGQHAKDREYVRRKQGV